MNIDIVHTSLVGNLFDIVPTNTVKPEWWNDMPFIVPGTDQEAVLQGVATVKACPAVHTLFNIGYVLLSPADIEIRSGDTDFEFKLAHNLIEKDHVLVQNIQYGHIPAQFNDYSDRMGRYIKYTLKLNTDVFLLADEPCNFVLLDPFWAGFTRGIRPLEANLQISNTIYDKNIGHPLVPNFLIEKNSHFLIRKGEPLLHLIPFNDQKINAVSSRLIRSQDVVAFNDHAEYYWTKKYFTSQPSIRGWLKSFVFKNKYSFKQQDGSKFVKRFKKKWWNR